MKKLNNKIFFTICTILTVTLLTFLCIYNIEIYNNKKSNILNNLNMNNKDNPPDIDKPMDNNIKFMDVVMYTIVLDSDNNIIDTRNHSNNNISDSDIESIANNILNNNPKEKYIGNLYINKYAYKYIEGNTLIIIDLSDINNNLINTLKISIIIFILIEIIIIIVSKLITKWICKPVEESFNREKEFVADASHELKTPLAVIMASSEALEDNPKEKKWLNNIKIEADRMNDLIKELLDLAKSEQNIKEYNIANLSKVVELSTLTFESVAYEQKIKIKYDIDDNIEYKINESNIKELIEILLDNAIKHSYKNSTINISLKEKSNYIELLVINKGEPIREGEEEKIFERFFRSDKSRNRDSNRYGLGLSIAKNIVNNHNGTISAKSKDNITTFKVIFKK